METIKHILDDRTVYHSPQANFLVQVGRYAKGEYKTRYMFTGDLKQALFYYVGINIGYGYKKRLVMVDCGKSSTLAKASS